MQTINTNAVYIPSIDGKDIFIANNYKDNNSVGYNLRLKNGEFNTSKFINTLDYSLDLIKLRDVYERVYRRRDFSFIKNKKEYTHRIINVTFKYSNREFNRIRLNCRNDLEGKNISKVAYVKFGHIVSEEDFKDNIVIKDNELIAIIVDDEVISPVSCELLGKYFYFDNGTYKAKRNILTLNSVANIRENLYENGFICDGIKYVRFKRSSGSSRVGKCLFIDEKLYYRMHKWEMCGIKVKNGQNIDLASLEPYIALTLSSIIDTIQIYPENILVVDDYKSIFKDKVVATRLVDNRLVSKPEIVEISNSIWDGQSLMDKSLFGTKYENYGMLLLRARFFKSCCFNANIQQWFADNGITRIDQLNGYTRATRIEDVKLITTPSSIKYVKFGTMDKWFDTMESTFGVVKHEKPTHFFGGRMVQTHYQLINTLQMTPEEVALLVQPSLDYVENIKNDPAFLRHQISYSYHSPDDMFYTQSITSKNDIIYKMLGINDKFANTKLYYQFRDDLIKSHLKKLRCGHILVKGNYSTLCGNPIEMLKQAIGQFDGSTTIETNTVHSINFDDNIEILGSRSPHVTIGNILVTKNILRPLISKYLNPTKEIVYVNSINDNLLERLSGSDFDSDTMLLTDNEILIRAAKRNYENFPVPTKLVDSTMKDRKYTSEEQADLDIKTSINKIGEIINLSQELNSLLWDKINKGARIDDVMDLYCDIAQLDVMSNLEIDSAKRENPANNTYELQCLKRKYDQRDDKDCHIRPIFFKYLDNFKGYRDEYYIYEKGIEDNDEKYSRKLSRISFREVKKYKDDIKEKNKNEQNMDFLIERGRMSYKYHHTSMDYLQKAIDKFKYRRSGNPKILIPFSECLISSENLSGSVWYPQVDKIISYIRDIKRKIWIVWNGESDLSSREKRNKSSELYNECTDYISSLIIGKKTMRYLLTLIEKPEYSDISKFLFDTLFSVAHQTFYELIKNSSDKIYRLEECSNGDIKIHNFNYKKVENV